MRRFEHQSVANSRAFELDPFEPDEELTDDLLRRTHIGSDIRNRRKESRRCEGFKNKTQSDGQSKATAPKDRRDWAEREKGEDKTHEP